MTAALGVGGLPLLLAQQQQRLCSILAARLPARLLNEVGGAIATDWDEFDSRLGPGVVAGHDS